MNPLCPKLVPLFLVLALTFPFVARLVRGRFTWRQRDRY